MGLHFGQEKGAYVLRLLRPDGSQETRICDDEGVLADLAIALHDALIIRGWQPSRVATLATARATLGERILTGLISPTFRRSPRFRVARWNKC